MTSNYQARKALMWPRKQVMRWKYRNVQPSLRAMLELHSYSRAIVDFLGATVMNPRILHEAEIGADSVVLDVGAFTGKWAQNIVDRYDPVIYAFEPNPTSFARLEHRARENPKLKPQQYGLGDQDMTVDFTLNGLGSSMVDDRSENADVPRTSVRIVAVDTAWRQLGLGRVDLMKINIEGAEYPLLDRMIDTSLLEKVDTFLIQFHEWIPGARGKRRAIQQALEKTHRLVWDYDFVWEKWVRK